MHEANSKVKEVNTEIDKKKTAKNTLCHFICYINIFNFNKFKEYRMLLN